MYTNLTARRLRWIPLWIAVMVMALFIAGSGVTAAAGPTGAVYTLTNEAAGNRVATFERASDGTLSPAGLFATGGKGAGSGLGSEGALVLDGSKHWLFAVNAGSNDISVFAVQEHGLVLSDKIASGGKMPISITVHERWVYVLNAGGEGNITGFMVNANGKLSALPGSTRLLSNHGTGAAPGPAQIQFSPNGDVIVVTEKGTNLIDTYNVQANGRVNGPTTHGSSGATPFGFDFAGSNLIVSEAFGGAANAAAVSSYRVTANSFTLVSGSVHDTQTAACWVVTTPDGKYAFTTNAGSDSISSYRIGDGGKLSLLAAVAGSTGAGSHPIDMALAQNGRFLYALGAFNHAISAFQIGSNGQLTALAGASGLPASTVGLAAR